VIVVVGKRDAPEIEVGRGIAAELRDAFESLRS